MQRGRRPAGSCHPNLSSCTVAAVFLTAILALLGLLYFFLLKPKPPRIAIDAVSLPAFSASGSALNFTFSLQASVANPNRAAFTHYDGSLQLLGARTRARLAFLFIPAGRIEASRTKRMLATFSVRSLPLPPAALELESRMDLGGRVRVLKFFTHRVEGRARCNVAVALKDGSVLRCICRRL